MPIRDYPFTLGEHVRSRSPLLPLRIINPQNGFDYDTCGLIDTGACSTTIPDYIGKAIGIDVRSGRREAGFGAGGSLDVYLHHCHVQIFKIDARGLPDTDTIVHTIQSRRIAVVEGLPFVLLGVDDFLRSFLLQVNYPGEKFSVIDHRA